MGLENFKWKYLSFDRKLQMKLLCMYKYTNVWLCLAEYKNLCSKVISMVYLYKDFDVPWNR